MAEQQLRASCTATNASFDVSTESGLHAWIYWHYREKGFRYNGTYQSLAGLRAHLFALDTGLSRTSIRQAIHQLLSPEHPNSLVGAAKKDITTKDTGNEDMNIPPSQLSASMTRTEPLKPQSVLGIPYVPQLGLAQGAAVAEHEFSVPSSKSYCSSSTVMPENLAADRGGCVRKDGLTSKYGILSDTNLLISDDSEQNDTGGIQLHERATQIRHAPLLSVDVILQNDQHLLPQYGLIGLYGEAKDVRSKLFINTNVPFSMFLCGVQGSGKSHTTSCILENSLIPSKHLGRLQNPLSALVFSYGHFSGDGIGFSISEAAFLASSRAKIPGAAHVKKVHVLVSPSNYVRISKLYLQLPNVSVTPFKIKPRNLNITTILTLMNVNESEETPLYMAQVTQILREMSTTGGPFDYKAFKLHLKKQKFNPAQTNMLQMRLSLLESFLDMTDTSPEIAFLLGEITIMDMSCPFVDANTACVLFEIGLQQYLHSQGTGKMIVLDEAHKYMLKIPGAKSLNEALLQTIRLQRHNGARVVISTQEPTLLTDLIALCSVTVIHRFSSPEWFLAIRRHVPITDENRDDLMRRIESLKTGQAIVYSPNTVLGFDDYGNLIMGTSGMIDVRVRRRLTSDGGQSVLAV
ncbi:P-loop containing nucleoside triphosphate hydrolase [Pyrenophora seminiperda CCB06]|uniref:P-loop containing nucleoside triphosphate hydrolase n=1 Tax=Pyrenophora seminiperda CCB06 TaxID=1302712 RepID=A0A3M7LZV5_9PLEO|nr:P-loop containing nucleoside triphosphate hydrolase [Pyrenophora seminiperda CCB06]